MTWILIVLISWLICETTKADIEVVLSISTVLGLGIAIGVDTIPSLIFEHYEEKFSKEAQHTFAVISIILSAIMIASLSYYMIDTVRSGDSRVIAHYQNTYNRSKPKRHKEREEHIEDGRKYFYMAIKQLNDAKKEDSYDKKYEILNVASRNNIQAMVSFYKANCDEYAKVCSCLEDTIYKMQKDCILHIINN